MLLECQEVAVRAGWRLTTLLRTSKFFDTKDLVRLYKCHVLPVLEFPTAAIFHPSTSVLDLLDKVQRRFLREVVLSEEEALLWYNLAPLNTRRDMAALGLIQRTVLELGPAHFAKWFFLSNTVPKYNTRLQKRSHNKQLYNYLTGNHTELLRRSLLGQVKVYNNLPQYVVDASTVRLFQRRLQRELRAQVVQRKEPDNTSWKTLYSTRTR